MVLQLLGPATPIINLRVRRRILWCARGARAGNGDFLAVAVGGRRGPVHRFSLPRECRRYASCVPACSDKTRQG